MFSTFFMAGFECSTHRLKNGRRLDIVHSSLHETFLTEDYLNLLNVGIRTVREGIRWHLIEATPHTYDFSSVLSFIQAARKNSMQMIWDLFHYGWPDDIHIFSPEFLDRFYEFSLAFARYYKEHSDQPLWICPVNEISFFAWAGGDNEYLNPFEVSRGDELKRQLVKAALLACDAVRSVIPTVRIAQIDPVIHIVPNPTLPHRAGGIAGYNEAQYAGWDMLCGRLSPELGGAPGYLDTVGVNFYPKNQWIDHGDKLDPDHPLYLPFREILANVYNRFKRPIFIAETGTEDCDRASWFRYVASETFAAKQAGIPVEGLCLYPILNHPGWDDDRHCHNGLWDYADESGKREIYQPLAQELAFWQDKFKSTFP